jgi:clan AA aspartic protease
MIQGAVNNRREAIVPLRLKGPNGDVIQVRATVDSGYNGALTVSRKVVEALSLVKLNTSRADLADGSSVRFETFIIEIEWGRDWKSVSVSQVGEESLLRMRLLLGHELKIAVIPGGGVTITPLPGSG